MGIENYLLNGRRLWTQEFLMVHRGWQMKLGIRHGSQHILEKAKKNPTRIGICHGRAVMRYRALVILPELLPHL